MVKVIELKKEHLMNESESPLSEITGHLWEVDRLLSALQCSYVLSKEFFEWSLMYARELRQYHRITHTPGVIKER